MGNQASSAIAVAKARNGAKDIMKDVNAALGNVPKKPPETRKEREKRSKQRKKEYQNKKNEREERRLKTEEMWRKHQKENSAGSKR
mmetsp:Transcript_12929/g.18895  ORF Transcript_12929/g.18895 Transcript_12929/m.18895 type:complete len:86 (-) Transcript_12929:272-529(-)